MSKFSDVQEDTNQSTQNLFEMFRPMIMAAAAEIVRNAPPPEPQDPKPLSVEGVAELTDNTVHWVYKHTDDIPGKMKIGKRIYWDRSDVIEWMRSFKEGR